MIQYKRIFRKHFNKVKFNQETLPDLLSFQISSYKEFLGLNIDKKLSGIYKVLKSVFPVEIKNKNLIMEFLDYRLEAPEYNFQDCKRNAMTYSYSLIVTFRLILFQLDDKGNKSPVSFKDQEVFLADIPMISEHGDFMINGIKRVVVSQMHKSAGVFFGHDKGKNNTVGRELYNATIIPARGDWITFTFDQKDCIYFQLDKKKKLPVTIFLKFLQYDRSSIVSTFYKKSECQILGSSEYEQNVLDYLGDVNYVYFPVIDSKTREVIVKSGSKVTKRLLRRIKDLNVENIILYEEQMLNKYLYQDICNANNEVVLKAGSVITKESLKIIESLGIKKIPTALTTIDYGAAILETLNNDTTETKADVVLSIIRALGNSEIDDIDIMEKSIYNMFFSAEKYDLSHVGRFKINQRLSLNIDLDNTLLTTDDVISTLRILNKMKSSQDNEDDIDNLSNRRLRQVGELVENQFRMGVLRISRQLQEKSFEINPETCLPVNFFGIKPLNSVIKEFFTLSQLSQFMDETNPLSALSHKRRISALGPGGVLKERATFEVRDVHPSHYCRLCVIETPEGGTTGLINSPALFSSVDAYGFMTAPYYVVKNGKRTNEIHYLNATEQYNKKVISTLENFSAQGEILNDVIQCRYKDEVSFCNRDEVNYVEIIPMQFVSLTAAHIPFLNNNDAIRSLYGSNMQRQAVPLLNTDSPLVATGIEKYVVKDTGVCVFAEDDGVVEYVDNKKIIIKNNSDTNPVTVYDLIKFDYSNHKTFIHQKINNITIGQKIKKDDMLISGQAIDGGEIALGRNVLIAFMPWKGLNYEDAIILSSRLVQDDCFTSVHIETLEVQVRDTKLGSEEITSDIPDISKVALMKLDEVGIVRIGEDVIPGDIIVGKITPKSETVLTSEEKLLRAIFGDKTSNVQNSSLFVPSGTFGTVINVEVFTKRGVEKDDRTLFIEKKKLKEITSTREKEVNIIKSVTLIKLEKLLKREVVELNFDLIEKECDEAQKSELMRLKDGFNKIIEKIDEEFNRKMKLMNIGHDLPQGVLKVVKVYIASKRKIEVGDKMSGRHGNKGVVSAIVDIDDMPFMDCGTPIDMVLNSLGIPGRMNIGQIFETHLGFASKVLGDKVHNMISALDETKDMNIQSIRNYITEIYRGCDDLIEKFDNMDDTEFKQICYYLSKGIPFATPVFDGASYKDIQRLLELAGVDSSGQVKLRDGITGEYYDRKVTVGYKYMLKLSHLAVDKMHARSVGDYSLVTQHPIGGKKRSGAQRFGEMEFWALQAHGAAHTLQEMYTDKSDDIKGRNKLYSSLVADENYFQPGIPESFKVMLQECAALCFDIIISTRFDYLYNHQAGGAAESKHDDKNQFEKLMLTGSEASLIEGVEDEVSDEDSSDEATLSDEDTVASEDTVSDEDSSDEDTVASEDTLSDEDSSDEDTVASEDTLSDEDSSDEDSSDEDTVSDRDDNFNNTNNRR